MNSPIASPLGDSFPVNDQAELKRIIFSPPELRLLMAIDDKPYLTEVLFLEPVGFRVLNQRDLGEFWKHYHLRNGWLYEVSAGGWHQLESGRKHYVTRGDKGIREFLLVGLSDCASVICREEPRVGQANTPIIQVSKDNRE